MIVTAFIHMDPEQEFRVEDHGSIGGSADTKVISMTPSNFVSLFCNEAQLRQLQAALATYLGEAAHAIETASEERSLATMEEMEQK